MNWILRGFSPRVDTSRRVTDRVAKDAIAAGEIRRTLEAQYGSRVRKLGDVFRARREMEAEVAAQMRDPRARERAFQRAIDRRIEERVGRRPKAEQMKADREVRWWAETELVREQKHARPTLRFAGDKPPRLAPRGGIRLLDLNGD